MSQTLRHNTMKGSEDIHGAAGNKNPQRDTNVYMRLKTTRLRWRLRWRELLEIEKKKNAIASPGNRTRITSLEGSHDNHYTNDAFVTFLRLS